MAARRRKHFSWSEIFLNTYTKQFYTVLYLNILFFFFCSSLRTAGRRFPSLMAAKRPSAAMSEDKRLPFASYFCFERHDFLFSHSNGDLFTCYVNMLYVLFLKTSFFRA